MYSIIVWHRTDTQGMHNRVLMSAKTERQVLKDFAQYMKRLPRNRSFNDSNLIQLHCDTKGFLQTIKQTDY